MKRAALVAWVGLTLSLGSATAADEHPAVFRDLSPKAALTQANEEGKILLVRWTATWCGPCKKMDKTTWPHADVVRWVEDHAIAISADLDAQRRGATVQNVSAVPTLIAFKDGKEVDRLVGYRDPAGLMEWFSSLESGRTAGDRLAEKLASIPKGGEAEVDARYEVAGELMQAGRLEDAADQYIWLWSNIETQHPPMGGVRVSFMAGSMEQLALRSPACRAKFEALRDGLAPRIALGPEFDDDAFDDWVVLNRRVLGDHGAVIAWAEAAEPDPAMLEGTLDQFASVRNELIEMGRWDLAAKLIGDPLRRAHRELDLERRKGQMREEHPEWEADLPAGVDEWERQHARESLARLHTLALVLCLDRDARTIANEAMAFDPSDDMRIALVRTALAAGQARPMHTEILNACPSATEYLKKTVAEAVAAHAATSPASP